MRGQDLTQETKQSLIADNKRAFDEIFGDPFEIPEPDYLDSVLDGVEQKRQPATRLYQTFRSRSPIAAMKNNFDEGKETRNPAAPNTIDFICDVERIVQKTLTEKEYDKFEETYIYETNTGAFTQDERSEIEQRLGRAFRANHLSPVSKYFTSIRRNTPNGNTCASRSN